MNIQHVGHTKYRSVQLTFTENHNVKSGENKFARRTTPKPSSVTQSHLNCFKHSLTVCYYYKMTTPGKIVVRILFVLCVFLVFTTDYSGLLSQLLGGNKTEPGGGRNSPRPTNPGYGDVKTDIDLDADIEEEQIKHIGTHESRNQMLITIKNACLPKLICELNATPQKDKLSDSEKSLLSLIRDTSLSATAELTKYHFAAHMGQLISGIDGNGCHHFYPTCPFPGLQVLQMMKKVRMR